MLPCSVVSWFRFGETSSSRACTGLWVMLSSNGEGSEVCELGVRGELGEVIMFWTGEVGLEAELDGLSGEVNSGFMMSQFGKSFSSFSP